MSPPIYTPDGSEVSEIVLPDGSTASEVIGPDGNVVFEAPDIPDSAVERVVASDYDGSKWVADIGVDVPNFEDGTTTTATKETKTYRNQSIDVVEYSGGSSQVDLQANNLGLDTKWAWIYVFATRENVSGDYFTDTAGSGDNRDDFLHLDDGSNGNRIISESAGVDESGLGSADQNLNVYCYEYDSPDNVIRFFKNSTTPLVEVGESGEPPANEFAINAGWNNYKGGDRDWAEYEILEQHSDSDRNGEINRLLNEYNI